jgi:hypothetical protein
MRQPVRVLDVAELIWGAMLSKVEW